ncbi:hypothetical protein PG991_000739 [Apiospora marii]|uniref:Phosphoesterase n=1 Tax=Apiospora marii TaxID=335849 RepID=A0ABR1SSU5_9PEZI
MLTRSLAALTAAAGFAAAAPNVELHQLNDSWKSKIKNVVVLVEENRSFDTFCGGLTYNPRIDGLLHHNYCNSMNASDPNQHADVCAEPLAADVAKDDPNHSISGVNMQSEAINYYTPEHIPVFNAIAENFVLFDRWFCSVPGPTNPNRAYLTSGTSHGHGRNDDAFGEYGLPQKSIFEQLSEKNISWINYQNSTTAPGQGFLPDADFYEWTARSGANVTNVQPLQQFYADAAAGTLPQFTYINPECCSYQSYHPPSPINLGEQFIKGIYEAVRNSPQWDDTLFVLTFDEHGGFGDHVPPPVGVPDGGDGLQYTEKAADRKNITFGFNRLGPRVPTILISPWVAKGEVEKKGANNGGEYTHTSILGFLSELWGLEKLTPRVEWSATFEHLILPSRRADEDSPRRLPDPVVW